MIDQKELLRGVETFIDRIESNMRGDIEYLDTQMDKRLMEILRYGLFSGGKRFRPLLAVLSARLCGATGDEIYTLATSFEYLHLATLFHDDVIDQADTRRGKPSVCKQFGVAAAILAGDFLHARSMEIIGKHGKKGSLDIFCQATAGMVDGEFVQLRNSSNYSQSENDYFKAIEGKTAVLISATTEIGALQGDTGPEKKIALREYGRNLGYGFQIVDDLLDYQGDSRKTGKSVGNDLAEGKMTLPVILALESASSQDHDQLMNILQDPVLRTTSFAKVFAIIERYDGFTRTREKARKCIAKAVESLAVFSAEKDREISALKGLAFFALEREK